MPSFQAPGGVQPAVHNEDPVIGMIREMQAHDPAGKGMPDLLGFNQKLEEMRRTGQWKSPDPCQYIIPEPAFVAKTKRLSDGHKVFINITTHEYIGKPVQDDEQLAPTMEGECSLSLLLSPSLSFSSSSSVLFALN